MLVFRSPMTSSIRRTGCWFRAGRIWREPFTVPRIVRGVDTAPRGPHYATGGPDRRHVLREDGAGYSV